jgi:hypothetical protein
MSVRKGTISTRRSKELVMRGLLLKGIMLRMRIMT